MGNKINKKAKFNFNLLTIVLLIIMFYVLYKISSDMGFDFVAKIFKFFVTAGIYAVIAILILVAIPIILGIIFLIYFIIRKRKLMKEYKKRYGSNGQMYEEHQKHYDELAKKKKEEKEKKDKEKVVDAELVEEKKD